MDIEEQRQQPDCAREPGALTQPAISEADVPDGYMHPTVPACLSKDPLAYQGAIPLFRKQAEQSK
jgi:hypothetical protein